MKYVSFFFGIFAVFTAQLCADDIFTLASSGTPEDIQMAIDSGESVNGLNSDGITPLMVAASATKDPKVISLLIKAGAKINARSNDLVSAGYTAIIFAAAYNENPDVLSALLKAGAKVADKDSNGASALQKAAGFNPNLAVLLVLLKAGAKANDTDRFGNTPLIAAAYHNTNVDVVSALLKAGAKVNARDTEGNTALILAAENNSNPDVILALLNAGADTKLKNRLGATAYDMAKNNPMLAEEFYLAKLRATNSVSATSTSIKVSPLILTKIRVEIAIQMNATAADVTNIVVKEENDLGPTVQYKGTATLMQGLKKISIPFILAIDK
jgi:hypothetical protein